MGHAQRQGYNPSMEQSSRAEFGSPVEQSLCQQFGSDAGISRGSNRCTNSRQKQLPTVIENLGRAPPFESNQENLGSAGLAS